MRRAGYREHLDPAAETALKINISWHHWYPACSTAPWQLDGVTRTLLADGFAADTVFGAHNRTVVVDARVGERANKHRPVLAAHGVRNVHLYDDERWVRYEPRGRLLTLHDVFPEGVRIPERPHRHQRHPPAHHEDARLHHHHRRHEERVSAGCSSRSVTFATPRSTKRWWTC